MIIGIIQYNRMKYDTTQLYNTLMMNKDVLNLMVEDRGGNLE